MILIPASLSPDWIDDLHDFIFFKRGTCPFETGEFDGTPFRSEGCYRMRGHRGRHLVLLSRRGGPAADDTWAVMKP